MHQAMCIASPSNESGRGPRLAFTNGTPEPDAQPRRLKVLVVDDQRLVADTVREVLHSAGFDAYVAYGPREALELSQTLSPDLLLSDVLMPHMNGVDLAIAIRARHPNARVVLFSGQAGISEILEEAGRHGHTFELLPKPIHPAHLIAHLRNQ